jgi:1L-myo-inositol 1-phosphate cytidylyltransferase / CDP-L-myo-inositol myo-inositolphosphotransferase
MLALGKHARVVQIPTAEKECHVPMTCPLAALLFACRDGPDGEPLAIQRVAGITLFERQIRLVRLAGISKIVVYAERMTPKLSEAAAGLGSETILVRGGTALAAALGNIDDILVVQEGLVLDERLIALMAEGGGQALAIWPSDRPGAERIDQHAVWAGLARMPGSLVADTASALTDWDMQSTLLRAIAGQQPLRIDLATIDTYAAPRRREVPFTWEPVGSEADAARARTTLIAAAQKGCLDWPARFLHPVPENLLTRALLDTPVTPNMVTAATGVLGIMAGVAFMTGWLWTGLVLALLIGPLDGVDGKLARTRVEFSRWGDLEHVLDKIVEYGWYLCLAGWFATQEHSSAWAVAAIIILFALAEAGQGEFYRRFTGVQLDDAGPFERGFRLIGGRRNTYLWTLVPFAALGLWFYGLVFIASYAVVTFFVSQYRFFVRLAVFGRSLSGQVEANFRRTDYAFLPERRASDS